MALIAEEVVEEWLNRQGFFTIRGINIGVHEMDILAVRVCGNTTELRHYEVTSSHNPVAYICKLTKVLQDTLKQKPNSAAVRSEAVLLECVSAWIDGKFKDAKKVEIRNRLFPGTWTFHAVFGKVRHDDELSMFAKFSEVIKVVRMDDVINELRSGPKNGFTASGRDLVELIFLGKG